MMAVKEEPKLGVSCCGSDFGLGLTVGGSGKEAQSGGEGHWEHS